MQRTTLLSLILLLLTLCVNAQKPLVDVVYLKNGSVIKGTIIEQVPNQSIKIKTADGSVFAYKMDEIEKITKEEATGKVKNTSSDVNTRKGIYLGVLVNSGQSYYYNPRIKNVSYGGVFVSNQSTTFSVIPGLSFSICPTNGFGITTGFTITRYGTTYTTNMYTPDQLKLAAHLTYIEIPIIFSFTAGKSGFFFDVGPQIGFLASGRYTVTGTLDNENSSITQAYSAVQLFGNLSFGARIPFKSIPCSLDIGPYFNGGILNAFNTISSANGYYANTFAAGLAIHFKWHVSTFH